VLEAVHGPGSAITLRDALLRAAAVSYSPAQCRGLKERLDASPPATKALLDQAVAVLPPTGPGRPPPLPPIAGTDARPAADPRVSLMDLVTAAAASTPSGRDDEHVLRLGAAPLRNARWPRNLAMEEIAAGAVAWGGLRVACGDTVTSDVLRRWTVLAPLSGQSRRVYVQVSGTSLLKPIFEGGCRSPRAAASAPPPPAPAREAAGAAAPSALDRKRPRPIDDDEDDDATPDATPDDELALRRRLQTSAASTDNADNSTPAPCLPPRQHRRSAPRRMVVPLLRALALRGRRGVAGDGAARTAVTGLIPARWRDRLARAGIDLASPCQDATSVVISSTPCSRSSTAEELSTPTELPSPPPQPPLCPPPPPCRRRARRRPPPWLRRLIRRRTAMAATALALDPPSTADADMPKIEGESVVSCHSTPRRLRSAAAHADAASAARSLRALLETPLLEGPGSSIPHGSPHSAPGLPLDHPLPALLARHGGPTVAAASVLLRVTVLGGGPARLPTVALDSTSTSPAVPTLAPRTAPATAHHLKRAISGAGARTKAPPPWALPRPPRHLPSRARSALPHVMALLRRFETLPWNRLLARHCPVDPGRPGPSPPERVGRFAWAVLRWTVPATLLGDAKARRRLAACVARLVLARRWQRTTLGDAHEAAALPSSRLPWRRPPYGGRASGAADHRDAVRWLWFLLAWIALPSIRACFHIVESGTGRHALAYYRSPVWGAMRATAEGRILDAELAPVDRASALALLRRHRLAHGTLRFLPKTRPGELRAVTRLGRVEDLPRSDAFALRGVFLRPANLALRSAHAVLKHRCANAPYLLGCAVQGPGDVLARLRPFLRRWKARDARLASEGKPPARPHVFTADVSRAFDGVSHDAVIRAVERALGMNDFKTTEAAGPPPPPPSWTVRTVFAASVSARTGSAWAGRRLVVRSEGADGQPLESIGDALRRRGAAGAPSVVESAPLGTVLVDTGRRERVTCDGVLAQVRAHVCEGLVRSGGDSRGRWYTKSRGLPQGSILSQLLCGLVVGDCERRYLAAGLAADEDAPLHQKEGEGERGRGPGEDPSFPLDLLSTDTLHPYTIILRMVDDWLVVTSCPRRARWLAARLSRGFPAEGIVTRPDKTFANFPTPRASVWEESRVMARSPEPGPDGEPCVRWCGFALGVRSLVVSADYARLLGKGDGSLARGIGRVPPRRRGGGSEAAADARAALATRAAGFLAPGAALPPLLVDPLLQGPLQARVNVYRALLLAAMKTCAALAALPRQPPGPRVTLAAVDAALAAAPAALRAAARGCRCGEGNSKGTGEGKRCGNSQGRLSSTHLRYLGLRAFCTVLGRRRERHVAALAVFDARLAEPRMRRAARHLRGLADAPRHAELLKGVRF